MFMIILTYFDVFLSGPAHTQEVLSIPHGICKQVVHWRFAPGLLCFFWHSRAGMLDNGVCFGGILRNMSWRVCFGIMLSRSRTSQPYVNWTRVDALKVQTHILCRIYVPWLQTWCRYDKLLKTKYSENSLLACFEVRLPTPPAVGFFTARATVGFVIVRN